MKGKQDLFDFTGTASQTTAEEHHAPVGVQSRSLYLKKNILDRLLFGVLGVILHIVGKKYKSEKGGLLYLEDTPPGWLKK